MGDRWFQNSAALKAKLAVIARQRSNDELELIGLGAPLLTLLVGFVIA